MCAAGGVPKVPAHPSIAAVFARIEGPEDVTGWSMRTLEDELLAHGFHRIENGFERADATVELFLLEDDEDAVEAALNRELARRDIVYYNGHHFGGGLELRAVGRPIAVLDPCYSTQFYASMSTTAELIGNRERAITGSVYGFVDLLAAARAQRRELEGSPCTAQLVRDRSRLTARRLPRARATATAGRRRRIRRSRTGTCA